ncbi:WD repeat protein [Blastomyces dermatitidis ER-3]|uniref:WD repeat protein n=1 Tax=Ajellomyces dermatitidis (strain ER-3 / ATCC MYA-2586) TaxID=559297 RepID=A0ABP2ETR5_AJEDR|nr:WD repeat protein [Blastomyces dermatitidis ER-3]EEQ87262.2 WD repeat protein [Blastomyces dermatitidis ER-3]
MSYVFEHLDSCLPVTATQVVDSADGRLILSGYGPYLQLIDEASGTLLDRIQIFERNSVHGIQVAKLTSTKSSINVANFLIWGGQSFRLLRLEVDRHGIGSLSPPSSPECAAPDWILSANFYRPENNGLNSSTANRACLITAHNVLFGLELEDDFVTYQADLRLHRIGTGLKSVLYSADVSWLSPEQILVAAGTVFGEIVVWSCILPAESGSIFSGDSSAVIHHLFTGHEGSIFGVDISPEIQWQNDNQTRRFLASCSDDRTIRIWDISDCSSPASTKANAMATLRPATRSTGFGNIFRDDLDMDPEVCIAKAWGHASRIWSARFVDMAVSGQTEFLTLVSFGEDATCQVWGLRLQNDSPIGENFSSHRNAILQNMSTHAYHTGKNIWSMAVHKSSDLTTIYTGGADGSIHSFSIGTNEASFKHGTRVETYDIYDLSLRLPGSLASMAGPRRRQKSDDKLNRYSFVSETCIIGLSSHGTMNMAHISDMKSMEPQQIEQEDIPAISWENIALLDSPASQFSIAGHPELGIGIIGDVKGTLWWYMNDTREILTLTQLNKKITGIFFASSQTEYYEKESPITSLTFVTTSMGTPSANLFFIGDKSSPEDFTNIALDLPPTFLTTSAVFIKHRSCLLLGAKTGHLSVFDLKTAKASHPVVPALTVYNVHARDTVTSITVLQQYHPQDERILTTGRDGYYCIHSLARTGDGNSPWTLQTIHKLAPPFGPYIEGGYFDKATNDLILFGFKSTEFIIWNESTQTERTAIECGGAHRIWAYNPYHANGAYETFAWTKASTFNLFRKTSVLHRAVTIGAHGREIKVAAISEVLFEDGESKHRIIATGGEDTMIRISLLDDAVYTRSRGSLRCLRNLKKHNAGIQHLQWSPCGKLLFSSAGAEEFYVWRLRSIPGFGMGTICEGECPKTAEDSDLRITSFDVLKVFTQEDIEDSFVLCLAYSNSTVKVFHYVSGPSGGSFRLLSKGRYTTNCLTQIQFSKSTSGLSLITASTDGHVATWEIFESLSDMYSLADDIPKELQGKKTPTEPRIISWQHRHCIHQSSIKAMEISSLSDGEYLIVAGGDDNAISISRLRIGATAKSDTTKNSFATISLPQAHASAITTISILEKNTRLESMDSQVYQVFGFLIASSGNDQRLKLWSIQLDSTKPREDGISVSLLQDVYTAVADMASMGSFRSHIGKSDDKEHGKLKDGLVLCGVGVDLWSLRNK